MTPAKPKFVETIPANPGYFVLTTISDGAGYPAEVDKSPVVYWAIEENSFTPYPATLEGVEYDNVFILQPDGCVVRPCGEKFPSEADWLSWQQAGYTEQRRDVK